MMIRMFVRHEVADYDTWRNAYDAFDSERKSNGVIGDAVFRNAERDNEVTAYHDFESLEDAHSFAYSDRLREVMQNAGVASEPQVWFVAEA